jgi:hypothetical protein
MPPGLPRARQVLLISHIPTPHAGARNSKQLLVRGKRRADDLITCRRCGPILVPPSRALLDARHGSARQNRWDVVIGHVFREAAFYGCVHRRGAC